MLCDQETIKKVRLFGLNTYEAKIWTSLLGRGVSTAGELSDIANVPRSRTYDVLESLEYKGFVIMNPGKPIKYLPIQPKDVLNNLKKRIEQDTEKHLLRIKSESFNNLIDTFQEIYEKNINKSDNIVAVLRGRKNIHKHLNFLFGNITKNTIFSVENEPGNLDIINNTKNKTKPIERPTHPRIRMYLDDSDNTIIFPLSEKEIHPDYDLCIWIRNKQTSNFLKQLLITR